MLFCMRYLFSSISQLLYRSCSLSKTIMNNNRRTISLAPTIRRINNISSSALGQSAEAILGPTMTTRPDEREILNTTYEYDNLAPVMPAIDVVQQLLDQENKEKQKRERIARRKRLESRPADSDATINAKEQLVPKESEVSSTTQVSISGSGSRDGTSSVVLKSQTPQVYNNQDDEESCILITNPLSTLIITNQNKKQDDYEFIPKSVILDVYSNDPEVKRFLKQLPKIGTEYGYNEQDYKCHSCRRPIGMVFGQARLCHFDGHQYCSECHLGEKSFIPARILCNWDFNKYPISKRNQHFLTLISNEPMFELKAIARLLYKNCPELKEIEELRCQAFFIRSYCFTCVHDTVSFELTKLVWPREHLIKQVNIYSLEDLIQVKSGGLKAVLKNVITFGRQHVLTCMLCRQKGFICELCKSSQIIYPFDTDSVYRCDSCQSIFHKTCFHTKPNCDSCPRCQRLKARRNDC